MGGGGGGTAGFDDWEILLAHEEEMGDSDGMMMLKNDYFSIDSKVGDVKDMLREEGSVEADNPSWVDPAGSDAVALGRTNSGDLWPDSASDRSKISDSGDKLGLGFVLNDDESHGFEMKDQRSELGKLGYESSGDYSAEVVSEGFQEMEKIDVVSVEKLGIAESQSENVSYDTEIGVNGESCVAAAEDGRIGKEMELPNEVEKKAVIWWKLPLELVKFCVFRVSPLWSISVAAAMVGIFIVRRRLHNMKRKTKSLQMKVTMDDKKVDHFMSRAARVNEAFSVVRRVPIIQPSLPAPGVTPWPVMSMR